MYRYTIFLHVLSVLGFLPAHGASAAVMFRMRTEREPARIHALLDLSNAVAGSMTVALLLLLLTGIAAGFIGSWWGRGWIWTSLGLFITAFPFGDLSDIGSLIFGGWAIYKSWRSLRTDAQPVETEAMR